MVNNDWFFAMWGQWSSLSEEARYAVWSEYIEAGGNLNYPAYCDEMDNANG